MKTYFIAKSGPDSWAIYTSSTGGYLRVSGFYRSKSAADIAKWKRFGGIRPTQEVDNNDDVETAADKEYADRVGGHAWSNC